jgi:predicted GH43/DUF377 family glycosyl hydrolase
MNRRQFSFASAWALAVAWAQSTRLAAQPPSTSGAAGSKPAGETLEESLAGPPPGPWRRLFLDATVVEQSANLARTFHAAEKHAGNPVIQRDQPWEGVAAITGPYMYGTVFWEGDVLRLWYQLLNNGNHVGYAESRDGIRWTKPPLDIIDFNRSKANNLVVSAFQSEATGGGHCHNPSVIRCPGAADPERRYALYGFDNRCGHARVAFSPDGLHWRYLAETEKTPLFTSSDVVNFCYDPYQSRYFVTWKTRNRRGRAVGVAWSDDGLTWSKPFDGPVFVADDLDPDDTQIYGMPAFPYQGLYVGLPWIYRARYFRYGEYSVEKLHEAQADSPRTMEVQLAWSWDLVNWTRPPRREELIPRGAAGEWDSGMIVTARAPVVVGDKLYFYYGGCNGVHDQPRVSAAIGLATLRLDGFCSQRAGADEGWFITRREPFHEPAVTINAHAASDGFVVAEILDRQNRVIPGFARHDCVSFSGDSLRHLLTWKSRQFWPEQVLPDYKLRFWLKNAELYSYLPSGLDPVQRDLARFPKTGP